MTHWWSRSTKTAMLALSLLTFMAARPTAAHASVSCAQRLEAARTRTLERLVRCLVRTSFRDGATDDRCLARARSRYAALAASRACPGDPSAFVAGADACAAAVRAELSADRRCAVRTFRAVARSLRAPADAASGKLCRALRPTGCPSDCGAMSEVLSACRGDGGTQPPPQVTLPTASPDERVVLFGAYEAEAISTVTVSGQDEVTQTARVVIAEGDAPLYVVLASYESIIWRFEGDVSRVAHVVLVGYGPSGVTGIAADRVAVPVLPGHVPRYFYEAGSEEARGLRGWFESAIGRSVDAADGSYSVGTLHLPAATVTPSETSYDAPPGFDRWVYLQGLWFNPGGIVDIDPSTVVSSQPADAYQILPEAFGLARLVAAGDLEAREGYFYIARAIPRFPAGLYGAHSVTFVLGRGVPMPAGSPGHSCVMSEESGLPVSGIWWLCGSLPPATDSCSFPAATAEAQVVLFGAYEGDAVSSVTVSGQDEDTGTARVVVEPGAAPLYLVLAAYDDTIWRFEGATSRIERVIFLGYGAQGATGLPAARVTDLSGALGEDCVRSFYDPQSPEGISARGATERLLGRPVDVFAGSYSVGALALPSTAVSPSPAPAEVPPGFDLWVFETAGLRFSPGGIVQIDPAQVVSTSPAEPYEVLPYGFGLAQLVGSGALELRESDLFLATFYIARPIPRFPPGLYGAHLVRFILGTGVPLPAGSPGHSCVVSEETGQPIGDGFSCSIFDGT